MACQCVREPLTADEADRLANTCTTGDEKLVEKTLAEKTSTAFLITGLFTVY